MPGSNPDCPAIAVHTAIAIVAAVGFAGAAASPKVFAAAAAAVESRS